MATEIAHEPAAARKPMGLNEGTDVLSSILSRDAPEEPIEATEVEESETEEPVQASEEATEKPSVKEAKDEPEETEVTSEIELEPAQVAELLGLDEDAIDVDEDGGLRINAKIDGKPVQVSLKDLQRSYELAQTHEERLRQLGRERKAFQEESRASLERLNNQAQQFNQTVRMLEEEFAVDFQSVDWPSLRAEDPVEYNAKRLDYDDRKRRIEEYRAKSQQHFQGLHQEHQQRLLEQQTEGAKMLAETFQGSEYRHAPKWDEGESQALAKWIMDQGFAPQDVSSVGVWQVFKWARDSMLRQQELKQARETIKKVTKTTKISKPGKTKPVSEIKKGKTQEMKIRQRKSGGNLRETTSLIKSILER